jgi:glycerol-3-phosphate acyltransferase PlsY
MLKFFLLPLFAYLLGSIPWGLIFTRLFTSVDIRHEGSGNIGATNVARIAGPTLGALTLVGDMLKGAIPVWLATTIASPNGLWGEIYISLLALAAFSGHLYPVYTRFKKGGKGVATAAGCFSVISPMAFVVLILVFIMFVCWLNRVAVASLAAAAMLPVAVWKDTGSGVLTGCAVATAIFICFRHIDNIKRLLAGTEPIIWK